MSKLRFHMFIRSRYYDKYHWINCDKKNYWKTEYNKILQWYSENDRLFVYQIIIIPWKFNKNYIKYSRFSGTTLVLKLEYDSFEKQMCTTDPSSEQRSFCPWTQLYTTLYYRETLQKKKKKVYSLHLYFVSWFTSYGGHNKIIRKKY